MLRRNKSLVKILAQQKHSASHLTSSQQPLEEAPTKAWSLQPSLHTELSESAPGRLHREMPLLEPGLCPG